MYSCRNNDESLFVLLCEGIKLHESFEPIKIAVEFYRAGFNQWSNLSEFVAKLLQLFRGRGRGRGLEFAFKQDKKMLPDWVFFRMKLIIVEVDHQEKGKEPVEIHLKAQPVSQLTFERASGTLNFCPKSCLSGWEWEQIIVFFPLFLPLFMGNEVWKSDFFDTTKWIWKGLSSV
jgi:hypothetical protein